MRIGLIHTSFRKRVRLTFCVCVWATAMQVAQADYATINGQAFGTSYMVKVRGDETIDAVALQAKVQERLDAIDRQMSTYRADSDVSRFNDAAANEWFAVSPETAMLVVRANDLSKQTEGAFDITVGPVVSLWNFGAKQAGGFRVPTDDQVEEALQRVGFDKLEVRMDPPSLKKTVPGLEIDLSAIAKGYAVDAVAGELDGFQNFMIEIGGEVVTRGSRPLGTGWRIGLEAPSKQKRQVDSVLTLTNAAMATSGDYRNFHMHDGVTYSHTIDPKTGRPVDHQLTSVTILADDCATADALATAVLVMGPERGKGFATGAGIRALLVSREGEQLSRASTPGFPVTSNEPAGNSYVGMFLITAVVFGIAVLGMSIGTILANRRLQGSCGGMAGLKDAGGKTICDMCTKPSPECSGEPDPQP